MENEMHESIDSKFIPMTSITSRSGEEVASDVYYYTDQIVNVSFVGNPEDGNWVLVDAGLPRSAPEILSEAANRFGNSSKPQAIILTHGHFDHVGGLVDLVKEWNVPVYTHPAEIPYLTGKKAYPKPDATVEGGLLAKISPIYPNEPIDLGNVVKPLTLYHSVPGMEDWKWFHTPGHSPGHVSFFRERDGFLLAGDAFITVRQDSFYNVLMQRKEINGPPRYLTTDWMAAWESVKLLQDLDPSVAVTGHGRYMEGEELTEGLADLVEDFESIALPDYGRYVDTKWKQ